MPPKNNLSKLNKAETVRHVAVPIPSSILDQYADEASVRGVPVETLLAERLTRTATYSAEKPLYVNDVQRQELERMLDTNFRSPDELIAKVRRLVELVEITGDDIDPVPLRLSMQQIDRVKSRCHFGARFEDKVREFALDGINRGINLY